MILTVNIPKREQEITNSDVIKAIFPNIDIEQIEDIIDVYGMSKRRVTYDTDWWHLIRQKVRIRNEQRTSNKLFI